MPMLQLGQPRDLGIAPAANKLKPTNCAAQLQIFEISAILGTSPNI